MKILFYVFANALTGWGHWHRSIALLNEARRQGMTVALASNRPVDVHTGYYTVKYQNFPDFREAVAAFQPDWIIVDLPGQLPKWIADFNQCRICTLNGVGYNQTTSVDLRVIQGVCHNLPEDEQTVSGAEYVIIRPIIAELAQSEYEPVRKYAVWGGAADRLKLLQTTVSYLPHDMSFLLATRLITPPVTPSTYKTIMVSGEEIFRYLTLSQKVISAMGMMAWEVACLGLPGYYFSLTPLHLKFAQGMEQCGLIKAWPETGLPSRSEFAAFVTTPFTVAAQNRPDGQGASRVLAEIRKRSS